MKKTILTIISTTAVLLSLNSIALAMDGQWGGPFGGYCRGSDWGWYGARKNVTTAREAKRLVQEYFANDGVKVGEVTDRKHFFEVDIYDKNGLLIDVVIVDKRTGRIRSID